MRQHHLTKFHISLSKLTCSSRNCLIVITSPAFRRDEVRPPWWFFFVAQLKEQKQHQDRLLVEEEGGREGGREEGREEGREGGKGGKGGKGGRITIVFFLKQLENNV